MHQNWHLRPRGRKIQSRYLISNFSFCSNGELVWLCRCPREPQVSRRLACWRWLSMASSLQLCDSFLFLLFSSFHSFRSYQLFDTLSLLFPEIRLIRDSCSSVSSRPPSSNKHTSRYYRFYDLHPPSCIPQASAFELPILSNNLNLTRATNKLLHCPTILFTTTTITCSRIYVTYYQAYHGI